MQVLPLAGNHDRQKFDCGRQELNDWLRQIACQNQDIAPGELLLVDALNRARRIYAEAGAVGMSVDHT